jgi:hypothetical protein
MDSSETLELIALRLTQHKKAPQIEDLGGFCVQRAYQSPYTGNRLQMVLT